MNKVIFKPCSSTDVEQIINKIGFKKNEQNNRLESLIQPQFVNDIDLTFNDENELETLMEGFSQ